MHIVVIKFDQLKPFAIELFESSPANQSIEVRAAYSSDTKQSPFELTKTLPEHRFGRCQEADSSSMEATS